MRIYAQFSLYALEIQWYSFICSQTDLKINWVEKSINSQTIIKTAAVLDSVADRPIKN